MPSTSPHRSTLASASYAALRYEGVPPPRARETLGLEDATAARLEQLFQARPGGGDDPMRPAFARHAAHVKAVMGEGGYPALSDFCRR